MERRILESLIDELVLLKLVLMPNTLSIDTRKVSRKDGNYINLDFLC